MAREQVRPPEGVSCADWERVVAARRAEVASPVEELCHLGPALEPNQVLLTVDEVLTRRPEVGHFLELRTARIRCSPYRWWTIQLPSAEQLTASIS